MNADKIEALPWAERAVRIVDRGSRFRANRYEVGFYDHRDHVVRVVGRSDHLSIAEIICASYRRDLAGWVAVAIDEANAETATS